MVQIGHQFLFYKQLTADNCIFKVNNKNTTTRCETCSKLTIKTPEKRQWRCSGDFIVNSEHNFTPYSNVCIAQVFLTLGH